MKIVFSRHAKQRIKLYKIPASVITGLFGNVTFVAGQHEIVETVAGFTLPIKVVFKVEHDLITIITAYPLKRGRT